MTRLCLVLLVCMLAGAMTGFGERGSAVVYASDGQTPKVRIGVYDSRAVAVAYAASRFNPVREKMAEHQAAKAAGDAKRAKELEAWGERLQRTLHFQGFCRVPVTDLLEPVKAGLDQILVDQKLSAIAMSCDATAADVEVIDVTDALVELYQPADKTRQTVAEIRKTQPVPLAELSRGNAKP